MLLQGSAAVRGNALSLSAWSPCRTRSSDESGSHAARWRLETTTTAAVIVVATLVLVQCPNIRLL